MLRRLVLVVLLLLTGVTAIGAAEASNTPRCFGQEATIVGTPGPDVLRGTGAADVIFAGGGNDKIFAGGGNDIVCGGEGSDQIWGGAGADRITGGPQFDFINGGDGQDIGRDRKAWCALIEISNPCAPFVDMTPKCPSGFVMQASGVCVQSLLQGGISWCESRHNYQAENASPNSSASGRYQFLDRTWGGVTGRIPDGRFPAYGSEVGAQYSRAMHAPAWVQDTVAAATYRVLGTAPWAASQHCWG